MKVAAIVVSHGNAAELEQSLPALEPQVDELLVIANVAGSVPFGVAALANERPLGFGANVNLGLEHTGGEAVVIANPDAVPDPGAVTALRDFMAGRERCGIAGPAMVFPDGSPQPSRRRSSKPRCGERFGGRRRPSPKRRRKSRSASRATSW